MESAIRRKGPAEHRLLDEIRRALESRDMAAFAALFSEDGVLEEISSMNPPAHPALYEGRDRVLARLEEEAVRDPVGGWSREVKKTEIIDALETDEGVAFTEIRTYAAGDKVIAQHLLRKRGDRIERDRMVVAWDQGT